jgi:hypothetical protein
LDKFPVDSNCVPIGFEPDQSPEATQELTFSAIQFKSVAVLKAILVSEAVIVTVGAAGFTIIFNSLFISLPLESSQVKINIVSFVKPVIVYVAGAGSPTALPETEAQFVEPPSNARQELAPSVVQDKITEPLYATASISLNPLFAVNKNLNGSSVTTE